MASNNNSNLVYIIIIAIVAMFFSFLYVNSGDEDPRTITLSGDAQQEVEPDKFALRVGVSETGEDVEALESSVVEKMNAITASLRDLGFNDSELQTGQFRVNEDYFSRNEKEDPQEFRVSQDLEISSSKLDLVSQVIDSTITNGANDVSSLSFGLSDSRESEIKNGLLDDAFNSAKEKAEILAQASDSKLGDVVSVEVQEFSYSPYRSNVEMASDSMGSSGNAPSIERGEISVDTAVNVVFEIN